MLTGKDSINRAAKEYTKLAVSNNTSEHVSIEMVEGDISSQRQQAATPHKIRTDSAESQLLGDNPPFRADVLGDAKLRMWTENVPYQYLEQPQGDPWSVLRVKVDKYDDDMCKAWTSELDTILTFTGLFSAAVTAFCVEAFKLLSRDPVDATNTLLLVISKQLSNSSASPVDEAAMDRFSPSTHDVQTNVLYFVSLSLALSVSAVCILGKQWIREYQRDTPGSSCDAVRVRQARFDALEAWKLPQIMASLPIVLLAALMLFFAGLLGQLWLASNTTTAALVSVVAAITGLLVIFTTIVPAHWCQERLERKFTPFRSPQAMIYLKVYQRIPPMLPTILLVLSPFCTLWGSLRKKIPSLVQRYVRCIRHKFSELFSLPKSQRPVVSSWEEFDKMFLAEELRQSDRQSDKWYLPVTSAHRALRWISEVFENAEEVEVPFMWCMQSEYHPPRLISSSGAYGLDGLGEYVLGDRFKNVVLSSQEDLIYALSCNIKGSSIASARGLFQAEMCIRIAHRVLDTLAQDGFGGSKGLWAKLSHSFLALWRTHRIFDEFTDRITQQIQIHCQIGLVLQRLFRIVADTNSAIQGELDWSQVIFLLISTCKISTAPLARRVTEDILIHGLYPICRRQRSIPLIYSLGQAALNRQSHFVSWELCLQLFTVLDEMMVELCNNPEDVAGMNITNLRKWYTLRSKMTRESTKRSQNHLSPLHFTETHPCPSLDALTTRYRVSSHIH